MTLSYYSEKTDNARPYRAYENDFINPGNFIIGFDENEEYLECNVMPGFLAGGNWNEAPSDEEETYNFYFLYRNRHHIEVYLQSLMRANEARSFSNTFDLIKKVAKRYWLVNDLIRHIDRCKNENLKKVWIGKGTSKPGWDYVEALMRDAEENEWFPGEVSNVNSWHKIMTLEEVKEMIAEIGVDVKFPE